MPLFSFHCATCDKDVELLMRLSDTPICPACGGKEMHRLLSRVAPDLKTPGLMKAARAQARREGHTSNFSRSEGG
ncbi:hypothetical protein GCM10007301_41900 [Azorhizobium oxalatiphilum]|uniref:Putative regulatory protein FmdB zinc ribbon domain-containing protein n=1 Tax=Azorhizobium oxalatiphilum TaxID=980631 RepID=A0A917FGL8_9HYPH|nr:zinc ribbon domain-containing protein [Azorhizobium oxalatiphilum]GGF77581.1 hypothetical protein GCM10007301_41900 [Azorhizobium oxalatiphilum]